jgi:hypothetical protein
MPMTEEYFVKITGTKPLLMHNPTDLGSKPKLRRGEHLDPEAEAERYLYRDAKGQICIPAFNVKACIREAGRNYKVSGRRSTFASMIRAGLKISPDFIPLIYRNNWVVDYRPVVVQRQRIMRARPRFDDWSLEFQIENVDPTVIHRDTLYKILLDAGKYYGLGDFRPEFGLFEVEKFEVIANAAGRGKARNGTVRPVMVGSGMVEHGEAGHGKEKKVEGND